MVTVPSEDGLAVRREGVDDGAPGALAADEDVDLEHDDDAVDHERERLRDAFVDAFNSRDLDGVLGLVAVDVDCPDVPGDGSDVLAEELSAIWERSPGAVLTPASLPDVAEPCAVAWLPDEDGCWSRAALVCFDTAGGLITLVGVPDDADALERIAAPEPEGDELDAWLDWKEWESGEESAPRSRREG